MKQNVWDALKKDPYDVADFYHKTGVWRKIATHSAFENVTLSVISLNALWIAIDTDNNTADTLLQAEPLFQIVDHAFCWYFSFEWYIRFSAFKRKRDGLKDRWFVFDSCLVLMMVAETWVMTIVLLCLDSGGSSGMGGASILRLFRLLRLSRLARMLRSMPELMILIKGMVAASRSVFFTMCLLVIGLYLFAIAMRQLTEGTSVGELFFYSVPASMYKLTIEGVFLDNLGDTVDTIAASSPFYAVIFLVFVVFAALMVMNMLIGVLCEVVSAVASTEKEEMNMLALKSKLKEVMNNLDQNQSGCLTLTEFMQIMKDMKTVALLHEIGVDPIGLIDAAPSIFGATDRDDDDEGAGEAAPGLKQIDFEEFVEIVLSHQRSNTPSMKDLREMQQDLANGIENIRALLTSSKRRTSSGLAGMQLRASSTASTSVSAPWVPNLPCGLPDLSGCVSQSTTASFLKDGVDVQEVECLLILLQGALSRVQRPDLAGAVKTIHDQTLLDWADSVGETATSQLKNLHMLRDVTSGAEGVPYVVA
jgi:voltage-gated sodium channel